MKKKDSEKEKQIRLLEQALAESQLSAAAKDEVIRALRDAPEVDSPEEQARILEAAQRAVLQKYPEEVAAVAELLTKSASRLAGQVAEDPEARKKLEAELLQKAVDNLIAIGADEGTIVDALVRNTAAFSGGEPAPDLAGVNPEQVAVAQQEVKLEKQAVGPDTVPPEMTTGIFITEVQSTTAVVNWGPAFDDRTPPKDVRYLLVRAQSAAELATLEQVAALPPSAVVMAETAYVLRYEVTGLNPGNTAHFAVVAADAAGNRVLYPAAVVTTPVASLGPDSTPPGPGSGLSFADITSQSLTVSWGVASDDRTPAGELDYRLVMATSAAAIDTAAKVAAVNGAGVLFDGPSALRKTAVSGLTSGTLYHFALLVRDATGKQALYPLASQRTADVTPPVVGSAITFTNVTNGSLTVNWGAATDNVTLPGDLEYRLVAGDAASLLNTVPSALLLSGSAIKQDFSKSSAPVIISGLAENQLVYVAVLVRDAAGNTSLYPPQSVTTRETQPPAPGVGLTFAEFATTSVRASWGAASDNVTPTPNLQYRLVRASSAAAIDTLAEASAVTGASVVLDWSTDVRSAVATGLTPGARVHFALAVRDEQGNTALYPAASTQPVVAPSLTSHTDGQRLRSFYERFVGVCHNALGVAASVSVTSANPLGITPVNASCSGGVLGFEMWMPAGSDLDLQIAITTSHSGEGWSISTTFDLPYHAPCPKGYIGVAGLRGVSGSGAWNDPLLIAGLGNASASYGNASPWLDPGRDFCVMKYPAKAQTSPSNPEGGFIPIALGEQSFTLNNVIPDSRASGRPWTNISQTISLAECAELNTALLGSASPAVGSFALISNTQWQVLARSAEATAVNWSGGVVGTGALARGHSDDSMSGTAGGDGADINDVVGSKALAHPPTDVNGFFGTGQTSGEQRRTQTLPNGQVVWDLAGNVWSWVRDLRSELGIPGADDSAGLATGAWSSFRNGGSNRYSVTTNRIFGNFGTGGLQFSETQNTGQLFGGTAEGVLRGGRWNNTSFAGVFSANLFNDLSSANAYTGFRCTLVFSESP